MKKKSIIITICVIVVILVISLIIGFINYSNSYDEIYDNPQNDYYYENKEKIDLEMNRNVEVKDYLLANGNILVEVTNNNDYAATAKVYIEFLDENQKSITIEDRYINYIGPGKKSYGEIIVGEELKDVYKVYDVKAVISYNTTYKRYRDDVKLISFDKKTGQIKFKNNTGSKLDGIEWGLIYYDDKDQIIAYSTKYVWDVKNNKTISERTYLENVDYNRIEVILLEAYIR